MTGKLYTILRPMTDVFPASAVSPGMQRTESGTNKSSNEKEPRKSPVAVRHMPA